MRHPSPLLLLMMTMLLLMMMTMLMPGPQVCLAGVLPAGALHSCGRRGAA